MSTMNDIEHADEIIERYAEKDSTVDNGNLYFAATVYQRAYKALEEHMRDAVLAAISRFMFKDEKTGEWYYDSMCMSDGEYYLPLAIEHGWIKKEQVRRI